MKVFELFEAVAKPATYNQIKKKLDELFLSKLKVAQDIKDDIASSLRRTDEFHSDELHTISDAVSDGNMDAALDGVYSYFAEVSDKVSDYYSDKMNFGPGYKPVSIPKVADLSKKEQAELAEFLVPGHKEQSKIASAAKRKVDGEKKKAAVKGLTPEVLKQVAAIVKKYDKAGWDGFAKLIQGHVKRNDVDQLVDYLPRNMASKTAEFAKQKTGAELKKYLLSNFAASDYLDVVRDNFTSNAVEDKLTDDEKDILDHLDTIVGNKKLADQFYELIK